MKTKLVLWAFGAGLAAASTHAGAVTPRSASLADAPAQCANFAPDNFVTRHDLAATSRAADAHLLLRFVQFSDVHISDDDGEAINGASFLDPTYSRFAAAQRLQEEYSDEALNAMIGGIDVCQAQYPAEFAIATGDVANMTTIAELRRFIDGMDGTFNRPTAFERNCVAGLPPGSLATTIDKQCTRATGHDAPDSQSVDPNPSSPLYKLLATRSILQLANTERAALTGRAADGSINVLRETATRAPGPPMSLQCEAGSPNCPRNGLTMPWYMVYGNHDSYPLGTVPLPDLVDLTSIATGRFYMLKHHRFIDEFFYSKPAPGPLGHGFANVDAARRAANYGQTSGYYAFDAGGGRFRMIAMNTAIDGSDPRLPPTLLRNPFALSDGTIDAAQFAWIKSELAQAAARHQLVLVFSHHPDNSFAEFGAFAKLVPIQVTAAQLDAELASWPNVVAWVAGHTHMHRIRAFKVSGGNGSNGSITTTVACKGPGTCTGFWEIETASLIDWPQEQRMLEIFDNHDGSGTIRGAALTHNFTKSKTLALADDRCQFYLTDPQAVAAAITEGGLSFLCMQGGSAAGGALDRNVELSFKMPTF